jgi:hypothetical protein
MAHITYHGRGNGHDPEINAAKVENLRLANAIARTKLAKLSGAVLDRGEVEFVVSSALVVLRQRILALPGRICAEIHGLNNTELHAVRMQVERVIDKALEELADTLEKTVDPRAYIAELQKDDEAAAVDEDALIRKKAQAKVVRTAKRHAKARKSSS